MNKSKEIELLKNPWFHTMDHNGYIKNATLIEGVRIDCRSNGNIVFITYNKEYFN